MAFFLTPRLAPAYQQSACNPFGSCVPSPRPSYRRVVSRPSFPSFVPFLSQVDELLSELDREARRAQHHQRQQRKRAFRARFDVRENNEGYEVEGEVPGFEQENIQIEVTDEHTLKVAGNTETGAEQQQSSAPASINATKESADIDGVTLDEPEQYSATNETEKEAHSDTSSQKSYQATVEDDFEDLGAETSSTASEQAIPSESKGKEKAGQETAVQPATQPEAPAVPEPEHKEWLNERVHGSFERTFRFPERINAANVSASLRNGVLFINVPKAPAPQIRHVSIQ